MGASGATAMHRASEPHIEEMLRQDPLLHGNHSQLFEGSPHRSPEFQCAAEGCCISVLCLSRTPQPTATELATVSSVSFRLFPVPFYECRNCSQGTQRYQRTGQGYRLHPEHGGKEGPLAGSLSFCCQVEPWPLQASDPRS